MFIFVDSYTAMLSVFITGGAGGDALIFNSYARSS